MRCFAYIAIIGFFMASACTGVKTVTKGLENESFIELIGEQSRYAGGVDVSIGETASFKAEVNKAGAKRPKGTVYAIPTGKHTITIKHNRRVIYTKQIFVSAQETKQIILP